MTATVWKAAEAAYPFTSGAAGEVYAARRAYVLGRTRNLSEPFTPTEQLIRAAAPDAYLAGAAAVGWEPVEL